MRPLKFIKKIVYTSATNDIYERHNMAMAHMNLITLYKQRFQDIQEIRDQYMLMSKVCDERDLKYGGCEDDAMAVLKEKAITEPTSTQLKKGYRKD